MTIVEAPDDAAMTAGMPILGAALTPHRGTAVWTRSRGAYGGLDGAVDACCSAASEPVSEPLDVERVLASELDRLGVGAGRVSRQLPKETFETVVEVRGDAAVAVAAFSVAIGRLGKLLGSRQEGPDPMIAGVVGSGFLRLNPAVIEVRFAPLDGGRCWATVIGTAKEGMVKQRTAEKAVQRILRTPEVVAVLGEV